MASLPHDHYLAVFVSHLQSLGSADHSPRRKTSSGSSTLASRACTLKVASEPLGGALPYGVGIQSFTQPRKNSPSATCKTPYISPGHPGPHRSPPYSLPMLANDNPTCHWDSIHDTFARVKHGVSRAHLETWTTKMTRKAKVVRIVRALGSFRRGPGVRTGEKGSAASGEEDMRGQEKQRDWEVRDLTNDVVISLPYAVAHGGFSDIHRGVLSGAAVAAVNKGTELCPDIQVAVKLLRVFTRQEVDPARLRKRLNREVDVWKRLDHANIAKFYGVSFQFSGRPSLVMRWYDNGTAPSYLESQTADCRFGLVKDVARGLAYLHTLEPPIVHGDLKGNNVLVDDEGHGLLSDFGLSKVLALAGPTGNTTTTLAGSVRWQAPEMLFDDEDEEEEAEKIPGAFGGCSSRPSSMLSLASDVWSFGCTAYELLTGRLPYEHHLYDWRVIQDIMRGVSPVRPDDTILHQSKGLLVLLNRCWTVEPSKRPMMVEVEVELGGLALGIGG
ncbi:Serine/threonine-protein kinase STY8 [Hypsizygus marmoreus]|uniref:Serine/threonine-protein kinase STY8 n=1 Tax=Hypsizygus marmoreus TaxID=39966 RepID=A0A369K644_HYPMA|nr:Serine/threonine-protein kinase STY8 [Hypsizygus marmoreus]